jgi:hypothetical protein
MCDEREAISPTEKSDVVAGRSNQHQSGVSIVLSFEDSTAGTSIL